MMIARSIVALALGLLFVSMPAFARADDCASSSACPAQAGDPAPVPKPSFDCAKATTAVEKAICADPVLANWDRNMTGRFSLILASARPDTRKTVLAAQNVWLSQLSNCVPVVPAPEPVMIGKPAAATDATASPKTMSSCLLDAYQHYDHDVTPRLKFLADGLKFPFLPRLTFSSGDALCRKFLDGAIIDYETVRDQPDGDKDPHIIVTGGRWIDWNWGYGGAIAAERVDLDGKEQPSLLIETQAPGPGALEDINLYVQTTADPDSIIHNISIVMTDNLSDLKAHNIVEIDSERLF